MSAPFTSARLDALRALVMGPSEAGSRGELRAALAEAFAEIDALQAKRAEWSAHYEWSEALVAAADAMRAACACGDTEPTCPCCAAYDAVRATYPKRKTGGNGT